MAAIGGAIGFQCKVAVDDAGTGQAAAGASTLLDGLVMATLPAEEVGEVETTDHQQASPIKVHAPTLIDPGTLKFEVKGSDANLTRLRTLFATRAVKTWKITAPPSAEFGSTTQATYSFGGFIKKRDEVSFEKEGLVTIKIEVRVVSAWTTTAAA